MIDYLIKSPLVFFTLALTIIFLSYHIRKYNELPRI